FTFSSNSMNNDLLEKTRINKNIKCRDMNYKSSIVTKNFSLKARFKSFAYAWNGIISFLRSDPNAQIHLAATVIVAALSVSLGLTKIEVIIICFSVAFVWVTEMINTAIEKAMDFMSLEKHPQIKIVKDIAAGSVLIASIAAAVAGLIIFIPKFLSL
ncbi:MAG: diacylglycerol kinase, partial [Flavisolibacter sp.]